MTEKFIINQNGEIEDTMAHINFDSFMEILIVLNGQSRHLKKLSEENNQLKFENKDLKSEISWIQDCAYWQKENAFDTLFGYYMKTCDEYRLLLKENEQLKEQIKELKRNENLREIQITELRRLVNLATKNDFIKDSKKGKWRKELGF